jgi:CHAT domain-containing protein/tetratricopeptide (TPR) repeat protein
MFRTRKWGLSESPGSHLNAFCILWVIVLVASLNAGSFTETHSNRRPTNFRASERRGIGGQEAVRLLPGVPINQGIAAGNRRSYQIALPAGPFVRLMLKTDDRSLAIKLSDPSHRTILELNNCRFRATAISFIGDLAGTYNLEIRSLEEGGDEGLYQLTLDQVREPVARDRKVIAAERIDIEADRLQIEWQQAAFLQSIEKYKEARALWRDLGDQPAEAVALRNIGEVYAVLGQNETALGYFNQALPLSRGSGDRLLEIDILNNIAEVQTELGERQAALDHSNHALALSRAAGYDRGQAQALNNAGLVYHLMSDFLRALDCFQQSLPLWQAARDRRGEAQTLTNIGFSYGDLGDLQKWSAALDQALILWRKSKDRRGEAQALTATALLNTSLGEMQKALGNHEQAIHLFQSMGNKTGEAVTRNGLALIYDTLGDHQRALDLYGKALQLFQAAGRRSSEAITLGLIGEVYYSLGDSQKALEYYAKKLDAIRLINDPRAESYALRDIGVVLESMGDEDKALDHFSRALALSQSASDARAQALTLNSLGYLNERAGQKEKALDLYKQALKLNRAVADRAEEQATLHNIARVARDLGQLAEAYEQSKALLTLVEAQRAKVASRELQAYYFASAHQHYELYIDILMRMHRLNPTAGYDAAAFEASERSRGRVLLDLLNEAHADIRHGVEPLLLQQERDLQGLLNTTAERQIRLLSRPHMDAEAAAVKQEVADLTRRYEDVVAQIRATSQKYADLTQPRTLSLLEIQQQLLDSDTIVLEYALGKERSYLWAVTPAWVKAFELPGCNQIEAAAIRLYRSLTESNQRQSRHSPQSPGHASEEATLLFSQAATELTHMLLEPVAPYLAKKRLVVVAGGALQYVPFAALWEPNQPEERRQDQPLVVNHEIVSLPSISVLSALRSEINERRPAPKVLAVFADPVFEKDDPRVNLKEATRRNDASRPSVRAGGSRGQYRLRSDELLDEAKGRLRFQRLPYALSEAMAITRLLSEPERRLALGFDATLSAAKSLDLQQYRILHFATHGLIYGEHPQLYGVVLSLVDKQGNSQDGFLRLNEVYNLKLAADLVVLSACQTALGKDIKGEGLVGLARGFMYAGAARVLASLWKVDDRASAELMTHFYEALLGQARLRPSAALRAAQLRMLEQPRWRSAYFWAAFTLQGEWK